MFYALITMRDGEVYAMTCSYAHFDKGELVLLRGGRDDGGPAKMRFDLTLVREIDVRCLRSNVPLIRKTYPFAQEPVDGAPRYDEFAP